VYGAGVSTPDVPIIDAHVHFWDPATTPRLTSPFVKLLGWNKRLLHRVTGAMFPRAARDYLGKSAFMFAPYLPADHRRGAGRHALRGLVHVQAGWLAFSAMGLVGETRWLEEIGEADLLGLVGQVDLKIGKKLPRVLEAHGKASPRFRGVRQLIAHSSHPGIMKWASRPALYDHPAFRAGYAALAGLGARFDAWMYHHQLKGFAELARAYPEVAVVLDHAGTPPAIGGPYGGLGETAAERERIRGEWREGMAALAALPHVHVKLSGLLMPILGFGFHERETPPSASEVADAIGPMLRETLDLFGEDRCLFASNFPMDSVSAPLETVLDAYFLALGDRPRASLEKIFAGNAARFYDLPAGHA
jgi:L-fuconolactonase